MTNDSASTQAVWDKARLVYRQFEERRRAAVARLTGTGGWWKSCRIPFPRPGARRTLM